MYLTIKKVKDYHYLYLIENNRHNPSKTPHQKTIKYLGRVEKYSKEQIDKIKELIKNNDPSVFDFILKLEGKRYSRRTDNKKVTNKGRKCVICGFDIVVDLHHIVPVSKGGLFEEDNLICLCPNHHEMLHRGLISEEEIKSYIKENRDI